MGSEIHTKVCFFILSLPSHQDTHMWLMEVVYVVKCLLASVPEILVSRADGIRGEFSAYYVCSRDYSPPIIKLVNACIV